MDSVGLDVAPGGVDEGFDPQCQAPVVEQASQLQSAVEPFQALGQALMSIGAQGGGKDALGSLRERLDDVIDVTRATGVHSRARQGRCGFFFSPASSMCRASASLVA
jgi:hypothetical protein